MQDRNWNKDLVIQDQVLISSGQQDMRADGSQVTHKESGHLNTQTSENQEKNAPVKLSINLSEERLANIKSPVYLKLETMIDTIDQFRRDLALTRKPIFQKQFEQRKQAEEERRRRDKQRLAKQKRVSKAASRMSDPFVQISQRQRSLDLKAQMEVRKKLSTKQIFVQYKINNYDIDKPVDPKKSNRITFQSPFENHQREDQRQSSVRGGSNFSRSNLNSGASKGSSKSPRMNTSQHLQSKDTLLSKIDSPRASSPRRTNMQFDFGSAMHANNKQSRMTTLSPAKTSMIEAKPMEMTLNSSIGQDIDLNDNSSESDGEGHKIKRRPGETKQQAIERSKKQREVLRIKRLMQFAYPRQLETHTYKKKLLKPDELNMSVDLFRLKQESMRLEKEVHLAKSQTKNTVTGTQEQSKLFLQLDSGQALNFQAVKVDYNNEANNTGHAINSVSTLDEQKGPSEMVLAESSIQTTTLDLEQSLQKNMYRGEVANLKSDDSLMMETDEEELYVDAGLISIQQNNVKDKTTQKSKRINCIQEVTPRGEVSSSKKPKLQNMGGNRKIDQHNSRNVSRQGRSETIPLAKINVTRLKTSQNVSGNPLQHNRSRSPVELIKQKVIAKRKELIYHDVIKMQSNITSVLQNFADAAEGVHASYSRQLSPISPGQSPLQVQTAVPHVRIQTESQHSQIGKVKVISPSLTTPIFMPKIPANANLRIQTTQASPQKQFNISSGRQTFMKAGVTPNSIRRSSQQTYEQTQRTNTANNTCLSQNEIIASSREGNLTIIASSNDQPTRLSGILNRTSVHQMQADGIESCEFKSIIPEHRQKQQHLYKRQLTTIRQPARVLSQQKAGQLPAIQIKSQTSNQRQRTRIHHLKSVSVKQPSLNSPREFMYPSHQQYRSRQVQMAQTPNNVNRSDQLEHLPKNNF